MTFVKLDFPLIAFRCAPEAVAGQESVDQHLQIVHVYCWTAYRRLELSGWSISTNLTKCDGGRLITRW
jgi:hypothetical protein